MKLKNLFAVSLLVSLLACGGGDGNEQPPEQAVTSSPPPLVLQTTDLLAPDDFKYHSARDVRFLVEVLALENQRAFVLIYGNYQKTVSQQWRPDFGSRILIQKLADGRLEVTVRIDNNVNRVLIEVWTDQPADEPYVLESAIENGELIWRI